MHRRPNANELLRHDANPVTPLTLIKKRACHISARSRVGAPPERVYGILADYNTGHPSILPSAFTKLTVEKGGVGAGTTISFELRLLGRARRYRASVTEPEPGRVLMERILDNDAVTTFRVDPGALRNESDVTITTKVMVWPGVVGQIQGFVLTWLLESLYRKELSLLRRRVKGRSSSSSGARVG